MSPDSLRIRGLRGMPEIHPGDNLCALICAALEQCSAAAPESAAMALAPSTIFVVAQKIVSKAEGRFVLLETIEPSARAREWATRYDKDPRFVEVVLREAKRIVRMERGVLIAETRHGFVCANAGVDSSNAPKGTVILLPEDPDLSARRLQQQLEDRLGVPLGVVISDTFGRPWRQGLTNVALGVAGFSPLIDYRGRQDCFGRTLQATVLAVADELSGAAELVMGKTLGIPVALIEGLHHSPAAGGGRQLIRPPDEDLFR